MAVHLNIPLRLPLRNAMRLSIHGRSIAASAPLLPAKATEGAGAMLLLRPQCCTVAAAVVSHERFCTITTTTAAVLLLRTPKGTVAVVTTAVGAIAAAIAMSAIIAAATSRGSGEDGSRGRGGGYRGGNDVSMRGRLVSNAVTHPMAVLATGVADPFESRRCPADPGHVALSPAPFTVGPRAVGRGRRFLLGPPSGVGTAVECPPETKIRRQRF